MNLEIYMLNDDWMGNFEIIEQQYLKTRGVD